MKQVYTCYLCDSIIEPYEQYIKIQPRGGRMRRYHEACIKREMCARCG